MGAVSRSGLATVPCDPSAGRWGASPPERSDAGAAPCGGAVGVVALVSTEITYARRWTLPGGAVLRVSTYGVITERKRTK